MLGKEEGIVLNGNWGTFLVSENKNLELFIYQQCLHEVEQERIL